LSRARLAASKHRDGIRGSTDRHLGDPQAIRGLHERCFAALADLRGRARDFTLRVARPRALDIERSAALDPRCFATDVMARACDYRLFFVPAERRIGKEGAASPYVSLYLSASRGPVGAIGTGLARRALECLVGCAKHQRAGAGPAAHASLGRRPLRAPSGGATNGRVMRAAAGTVLGAAALLGAVAAMAGDSADPGADEVTLKNGGMLRGTVVAIEPDRQVVIMVGGKTRTLAWKEVERVERGKHAAATGSAAGPAAPTPASSTGEPATPPPPDRSASTPVPAPPATGAVGGILGKLGAAPPPPPGPGVVRVHLFGEREDKVGLYRVGGQQLVRLGNAIAVTPSTELICSTPCDTIVDGRNGASFFLDGEGMPPSEQFSLQERSGDLGITVERGSSGLLTGGFVLALLGGSSLLPGALMAGIGGGIGDDRSGQIFSAMGSGMLGGGGGALVVGILMMAASGTHLRFVAPDDLPERAGGTTWRF
jgi:hypothetical protein